MAEWQTQQTQNLPVSRSCGFKSHHPHENENALTSVRAFLFSGADGLLSPKLMFSAPLRSSQNRRPPDVVGSSLRFGRPRTDVHWTSWDPPSAKVREFSFFPEADGSLKPRFQGLLRSTTVCPEPRSTGPCGPLRDHRPRTT